MTGARSRIVRLIVAGIITLALVGASGTARGGTHAAGQVTISGTTPVLASGVAPAGLTDGIVTATVTADAAVGGTVPVTTLASAAIDASGNYTLTANPGGSPTIASAVKDAIVKNGGWLNIDLTSVGANGETVVQSIARQFVGSSGAMVSKASIGSAGTSAGGLGAWVGDEADNGSTTVDPTRYAVVVQAGTAAARAAASRMTAAKPSSTVAPDFVCFENATLVSQTDVGTVVGEMHTANGIVKGNGDDGHGTYFSYGSTSDSSIDVGIEESSGGPWNVSGSVHIGNSNGSTQATIQPIGSQFGYKIRSGFMHQHWHYSGCSTYEESTTSKWTGVPYSLNSPPADSLPADYNHNLDNDCKNANAFYTAVHFPGSAWSRTTNQLHHFSVAFSAFGFEGGSQSGASRWVTMRWQWDNTSPKYWLCGDDNDPGDAHRIFAGY
jgi:hypothetical protein